MNLAANGSVRAPYTLKKLPTNSALELFIQNGATIQSAIFVLVHSYSYLISIPLVLRSVYGQ